MEENNPIPQPSLPATPQPSNGKLITVLLTLIFFSPIGLILMWVLMKDWPTSAKRIVTLIYIVLLICIVGLQFYLTFLIASNDPFQKLKNAEKRNTNNLQIISPTPITPSVTKSGKLSSIIYQLTTTTDPTKLAEQQNLTIKKNMVFVTLKLVDKNFQIPASLGEERARYENLVDAYIYIDKLVTLAENPAIEYIDAPTIGGSIELQ